jgi:enterobactin synthetase component D
MQTQHLALTLASHPLHLITFDATTFNESDLLWLPHYPDLQHTGRKRKTEHLAGRIAAVHALREFSIKTVPGFHESGAPRWPDGLYGSISHSGNYALAVVGRSPVGVDIEALFSGALCSEVAASIITPAEHATLKHSTLPFPLALTLVFCAKESLFKAFSSVAAPFPGFHSAQVVSLNQHSIRLCIEAEFSSELAGKYVDIAWMMLENHVITLAGASPSGS